MSAATVVVPIAAHDPNSFANNRAAKVSHSHINLAGQRSDTPTLATHH